MCLTAFSSSFSVCQPSICYLLYFFSFFLFVCGLSALNFHRPISSNLYLSTYLSSLSASYLPSLADCVQPASLLACRMCASVSTCLPADMTACPTPSSCPPPLFVYVVPSALSFCLLTYQPAFLPQYLPHVCTRFTSPPPPPIPVHYLNHLPTYLPVSHLSFFPVYLPIYIHAYLHSACVPCVSASHGRDKHEGGQAGRSPGQQE